MVDFSQGQVEKIQELLDDFPNQFDQEDLKSKLQASKEFKEFITSKGVENRETL